MSERGKKREKVRFVDENYDMRAAKKKKREDGLKITLTVDSRIMVSFSKRRKKSVNPIAILELCQTEVFMKR